MEILGKEPRGNENRNYWCTDKLERGQKFEGWIAGAPLCVTCHESPVTKVCVKRYVGFDAACPGCASRLRVVDMIYQPVYRSVLLTPCVVPFRESQKSALRPLQLHDTVIVSRPSASNRGRQIEKAAKQVTVPWDAEHQMPRCIAEWLPVLWKYQERITGSHLLRGPVFAEPSVPVATVPVATATEEEEIETLRKLDVENRRRRLRGKTEMETTTNILRDVIRHAVPSQNGQHSGEDV